MRFLVLMAGFAFLAGCANYAPVAPKEQDRRAKQFQPSPNTGTIYIYWEDVYLGAPTAGIRVGDSLVGKLGKDQFLIADVSPGRHIVFADTGRFSDTYPVEVEVEAGTVYFIVFTYESAMEKVYYSLNLVSPEEGRKKVNRRNLARLYPVGIVQAISVRIVD